MRTLIKIIVLCLNLIAVVALLAAYLSGYVSPEKWWIPSFFGLAYLVVLGVNLFFIVFWLIVRPRYMLLSLLTILAGWGVFNRFIQFKGKHIEKGDIKILSYNVHHFGGNKQISSQQTAAEIVSFLEEQSPDIICLQEARLRQNNIFNLAKTVEELSFINHYQYARTSSTFGSVTLSRFPIVNMDEIRFDNSRNITICTDVVIGNDTVRVFNVHLHSYGIDPKDYSIIDSGVSTEEELKDARKVGSKLKSGFMIRANQVETIRKMIDETPYPVVVCGDLNDVPASFSYQQIQQGLKDAFVCSGKGLGRTFINMRPFLRIDYIFHSPKFESFNYKTHNFRYSDHLPVSTELVRKDR
ncbi:Metal-dependent hydrolase, endonuclease/exonuclease/phosphatase family [Mariniphaga anaerophila]|uniref:Metal-dependent hydrolase, endonuclease/exonuclease/phosphatase family n=1 Tax=Mariniphaga anaerophila TaxID=1484053 RepID=A0A1M5CDM0_9BACT|nr:endonuclease/exonuclease/phosphatase family protein [Mariniphaga anaerophila]SHF52766.1 Metal-dependent hydrolase, endonuclease/exonuclease/phosphatase family [Mariniphaga anaerophila]